MWGVTAFPRRQTQGALPFSMWGVTGFLRRQTRGALPFSMWGVTGFLRRQTQGALPFSMWGVTGFLRRQTQGASPIIYIVVECHRVPALSNPGALPFSMLPFSERTEILFLDAIAIKIHL